MVVALLIIVASLSLGVWIIYTVLSLAPWFPTRSKDITRIGVLAGLCDGETFVDLGSGDGRVVFGLAYLYPQVQFVGVELSFFWYGMSATRLLIHKTFGRLGNIEFVRGSIYRYDYTHADVVYVFGTQRTLNGAFTEKVLPRLGKGVRLLSYNFYLEDYSGDSHVSRDEGCAPIYKYIIS